LKIEKIKISSYKVLQNFEIDFTDKDGNILNTIVLAGVNGSGKTTVLELIKDSFDLEFRFNTDDDCINFDINDNRDVLNYISIKPKYFDDTNRRSFNSNWTRSLQVSVTPIFKKYFELLKSQIIYFKVFENKKEIVISQIKNFIDLIKDTNEDLTIKQANQKAVDEINSIFDGLDLKTKFKGISKDINRDILFENDIKDDIKLDELSTGEQQLFIRALSLKMMDLKDCVILIDEPEISLHPNWQNQILKVYMNIAKAGNNQLIIATHSPQIISSTPNESLRVLVKNAKDIEVKSFDKSYGAEIEEVLQDLMGTKYLRTPEIAKQINTMWDYLNSEDLENFEKIYNELESILDLNDKDLVLARLEKAKILSCK
jgi:predicted ATP-binding protein involved in virulence